MDNSKISNLLWIISGSITLTIILLTCIGGGIALQYGLVSTVALVCWLKFSNKPSQRFEKTLPLYLLTIIVLLTLFTARYAADFSSFLNSNFEIFLTGPIEMTHINWFIWMVCLPVSLMLYGGYLLSKNHPTGYFFAWWGFTFSIIESILQFIVELLNRTTYSHVLYSGLLISMVLFLISILGILNLIKSPTEVENDIEPQPLSLKKKNLWTILLLSFVTVYATTLYVQAGKLPVGIIVGSMVCGIIGWRKTTANRPADPYKFVPLYLLLLALFYVHIGEEVLTNFNQGIAALSGHNWNDVSFNYTITFLGPIVWFYGAYSLWKKQVFGNFILWFMMFGMILGEPTHLIVFPIVRMVKFGVGYEYFSGMYTALFPMIPAIIALIAILKDYKKGRRTRDV
jgi:hypothetical protein